ncbi:hypothetical protein RND71_025162 [Anisodus tanguticus]|uniref:Uncharacterized protein n=1 Tax=Anisodus tanguticus TaxID=243964 RepID=A0AAE1RQZ3_9SOLA|nr:hypothetical protein RND71_025162 [Anisodus tanguticus]
MLRRRDPAVVGWPSRNATRDEEKGKQSSFMLPECDYLRSIAMPRLHVSTVVDAKTGKGIKSDVRTSSGMFLSPDERKYPMIQAIEKRIDVYSQIPAENGELIQVLRLTSAEAQDACELESALLPRVEEKATDLAYFDYAILFIG